MRYVNILIFTIAPSILGGCASLDCKPNKGTVLPGTDTAVVEIYIDKSGYPQVNTEKVFVYPGQKIIFVGPDKFDILFKDQKSPTGRLEIPSSTGIVTIEIPRDIFERNIRETKSSDVNNLKELIYRYGIRYKGKVTDPTIVVGRH